MKCMEKEMIDMNVDNIVREKGVDLELVRWLETKWSIREWAVREYNRKMDSLSKELTLEEWNDIVEEYQI